MFEGSATAGDIEPGPHKTYDLELTRRHIANYVGVFSDAVKDLRRKVGITIHPFPEGKLAPAAAPKRASSLHVMDSETSGVKVLALKQGPQVTESKVRETIGPPSNGTPNMFFVCLGAPNVSGTGDNLQHIKVGATIPVWKKFQQFAQICYAARDFRFGPDSISKIKKAIDALVTFEAEQYKEEERNFRELFPRRQILKTDRSKMKVDSRLHAVDRMRSGHKDFINRSEEIGQAYGGDALTMKLACYCCQGIFGYRNVLNAVSEN